MNPTQTIEEKWAAEKQEKAEAFAIRNRETIPAIAEELGLTYEPQGKLEHHDGYPERFPLTDEEGREFALIFNQYGNKGRIVVLANFPRDKKDNDCIPYGMQYPRITISESKTVKQIAGDIKRRFLDEFHEAHALIQKRVDESDAFTNGSEQVRERLIKAGNLRSDRYDDRKLHSNAASVIWSVEANRDRVSIDLKGLSPDQAEQVLQFTKEMKSR
jgi:hypothetical protein